MEGEEPVREISHVPFCMIKHFSRTTHGRDPGSQRGVVQAADERFQVLFPGR